MKTKRRIFLLVSFCFLLFGFGAFAAVNLTATVSVEKTADTAAAAKTSAFDAARRDIVRGVLARYSDGAIVSAVLENTPDTDLVPLVATSSISNERASNSVYNATITMTLDQVMVTKWMQANNIPNYMAAADDAGDRVTMFFYVGGGLRQWAALMTTLREQGLSRDIDLKTMQGRNVSVTVPAADKSKYLNVLRTMGWRVTDTDGILRVTQ